MEQPGSWPTSPPHPGGCLKTSEETPSYLTNREAEIPLGPYFGHSTLLKQLWASLDLTLSAQQETMAFAPSYQG